MINSFTLSTRMYGWLLHLYPAPFRAEYGPHMAQTFRDCCRDTLKRGGATGLLNLWASTAWDLALTAAREHLTELAGRSPSMDTKAFDRQLGDVVWIMETMLRSGYSVKQIFEALAQDAPEPTAGTFKVLLAELSTGKHIVDAVRDLQSHTPSAPLQKVVAAMLRQFEEGGNLADRLQPLASTIRAEAGSDPALHAMMRDLAARVNATVPEHAKGS